MMNEIGGYLHISRSRLNNNMMTELEVGSSQKPRFPAVHELAVTEYLTQITEGDLMG